ncbi:unnamed protein product [Phytomonas sp. Hart1]|nr:unnamed protein product [Phytomonas sp. Hart1]|eukprot:CCW70661.1 unnamed protein product [Phytomonas sp. isolate Hart1]
MPRMRLDFLKNTSQRVATGRSLPLRQVEAILLYGRPEGRAKVIQAVLPAAYRLALSPTTHHLFLTLLDHTDDLTRVRMLYHIRREIAALARSATGNVVLQRLFERLPGRHRRELAEDLRREAEGEAFLQICTHPFGNHVAQRLVGFTEGAEVLGSVLTPHLARLAVDSFGMRVVARYVEEGGADAGRRVLQALIPGPAWERIARGDDDDDDKADEATSKAIDHGLAQLFNAEAESMVIAALFRQVFIPISVKDAICAHLCEFAEDYLHPRETPMRLAKEEEFAMPEFSNPLPRRKAAAAVDGGGDHLPAARHSHAFVAVFEHGDSAQREALWTSICEPPKHPQRKESEGEDGEKGKREEGDLLEWIVARRETVPVVVAAVKSHEGSREAVWQALFHRRAKIANGAGKEEEEAEEALTVEMLAQDSVRSMILRAFIDVEPARLGKEDRLQLYSKSLELSKNPVSSPVLQRLIEMDGAEGEAAGAIYAFIQNDIEGLINHSSASYLLQSLLQFAPQDLREAMVREHFFPIFVENLRETLSHSQGSRVMQKLLAYATDEVIIEVVKRFTSEAETVANADEDVEVANEESDKEEESQTVRLSPKAQRALNRIRHYEIQSSAIVSYALHQHACYVIRSLLHETRSRKLDQERKLLMNELKPHVFNLAVSPWAGRVVLDAMMGVGSEQLSKAMKNVVFLKAEAWLSEVSEERKKKGTGIDPTIRSILQDQRKRIREGDDTVVESNNVPSAPKKKSRHLHKTLKK